MAVTLIEEEPYAAVVWPGARAVTCVKCFSVILDKPLVLCKICRSARYCSHECRESDWKLIHKDECGILKEADAPVDVRFVIRILLRLKNDPWFESYNERTWYNLDPNMQDKIDNEDFRTKVATPFYDAVKGFMGDLTPPFDEVIIAWGKTSTNALPITDNTWSCNYIGMGLYIGLSVHGHKCIEPDCWVVSNGSKMILRTTNRNVLYSARLTIDFLAAKPPKTTEVRRKYLQAAYGFTCECDECTDKNSDLKLRSGICPFCGKGWFTAQSPFCLECLESMTKDQVEMLNSTNTTLSAYVTDLEISRRRSSERDAEKCNEAVTVFYSMANILPICNMNMMALIEIITRDTDDEDVCNAFLSKGLPVIKDLKPSPIRYTWICRRVPLLLNSKRPNWEYQSAAFEALACVKVSHGNDHPLTLTYQRLCDSFKKVWVRGPPPPPNDS